MEKTLIIDGHPVTFRSTGAFLLRYKAQFRRDALKDLVKLAPTIVKYEHILTNDDIPPEIAAEIMDAVDMELFFNFSWVLAKSADPSIPDPDAWLNSFSEFPIMDIIGELQELITASLGVSKKK